jgi:hypothetical protein
MRTILVAAAAGLVLAGVAGAAAQGDAAVGDTYKLTANLRARFEVPKPTGVPAGAVGLFTGKAVVLQTGRSRLTWRLTFSKLSGRAAAAHIHKGRAGKAGAVMVALCGPCRSGRKGAATISMAQLRTIRTGRAYVNVHTAKNPAGEIRGQVKATAAGSSSDPVPPPAPPPEPPPTDPYP